MSPSHAVQAGELPKGWVKVGAEADRYEAGVENDVRVSGAASAFLRSKDPRQPFGFGSLKQSISAERYKGKRVRLRAHVKLENVIDWSGLWMRVDGVNGKKCIAFDNMKDRKLSGTASFQPHDIVLDVPANAESIHFGVLLNGGGRIWADSFSLKVVADSVPVTRKNPVYKPLPKRPANLSFE